MNGLSFSELVDCALYLRSECYAWKTDVGLSYHRQDWAVFGLATPLRPG
jgi:hypothetical protein